MAPESENVIIKEAVIAHCRVLKKTLKQKTSYPTQSRFRLITLILTVF